MKESRKIAMNKYANQYIQTGDVQAFEDLYNEFNQEYGKWFNRLASTDIKNNDAAEIRAQYEDALMYALKKHTPDKNFAYVFLWKLKRQKLDLVRKQKTVNKHTDRKKETEDEADPITNLQDTFDLENYSINKLIHKELVQFFFDNANDVITRQILEEIPKHETLNAVAKHLGMQLIQVQRKLEKLKRLYYKQHRDKSLGIEFIV